MKPYARIIGSLVLFVTLTGRTFAGEAEEHLSKEAKEAIRKGLMAAGQKEWQLAIRYFNEAREKAPLAPEPLFNLGLAESKIPGREIRSIAW